MWGYGELGSTSPAVQCPDGEMQAFDMAGQVVGKRAVDTKAPAAVALFEQNPDTQTWEARGYVKANPLPGEGNEHKSMVVRTDTL